MKFLLRVSILLAPLALTVFAGDLSGTWKAVFTGEMGQRPKMVSEMVFQLKVKDGRVTGMAHMSDWPGDAPISAGWLDGDRVRFTVIGRQPWSAYSGGTVTIGYPKLEFTGTIHGDEMDLSLAWGSVNVIGKDEPGGSLLEMHATRLPD